MKKRLIVTAPIGYLPYLDETRPFILEYASQTGADYQEIKWFPESATYGESNYFISIEVLRRFSQQTYYEELLFLDADVLVLPGSPNIFEGLESMAMADDWYIPTQEGHFENWLKAHAGESGLFTPGAPYFNSGVIVITRETAARIDYAGPYPNVPRHDQDWLNWQVARAGIAVEKLDRAWNYRALENPAEAIANGHFLHFCGDAQAKARISEFTRLLA